MRGYIPPNTDDEKIFCRRIEDAIKATEKSGAVRILSFMSDREQVLATAVLAKNKVVSYCFNGGYNEAERKMLAIYSDNYDLIMPIIALKVKCNANQGKLTHRDFLGALMSLNITRDNLGDIILVNDGAIIFSHARVADIIKNELLSVGRISVSISEVDECTLKEFTKTVQLTEQTASVSSLRLDALLAAFMNVSRSKAAQIVNASCVEINHVQTTSCHSKVYEEDVFTIKGYGKYKLCKIGSLSKKGRTFITYIKY